MERRQLLRGQRRLALVVVTGTLVIATIGFVGSYDAVMRLAQRNGFGWFAYVLPIGIDVGITVFLALDLLLTWMRIPLALLRQLAWLLTAATIVFNAASAWPNPLATSMHAVVPLLFVAAIEAARHMVGRMAQIEADQFMEGTRLGRWFFAPVATFRLWRRRQLWELRNYQEALEMERRRLVFRARLRSRYGLFWRQKAPVDQILLLRLANLGEPLPAFELEVARIEPDPTPAPPVRPALPAAPAPAEAAAVEAETAAEQPESAPLTVPSTPTVFGAGTAIEQYQQGFDEYTQQHGAHPNAEQLSTWLFEQHDIKGRTGEPLRVGYLLRLLPSFQARWTAAQQAQPAPPAQQLATAGVSAVRAVSADASGPSLPQE
ncbi:hypothetical protein ABH940_001795 [Streptacidiphilus sp. BW17]|uniref:DUF2637 domain-containing protein n=1 Tax=Streptacidiphilus sp. BW17 TaxID=3156274 RepID=UPI003515C83C